MTSPPSRPGFSDIEAWGVTHRGKVRSENMDHFFMGSLVREADGHVLAVGFDEEAKLHEGATRLASLGVVADGVGSAAGGAEAARVAVRGLLDSLVASFEEARVDESTGSEEFTRLLHEAALACHESLLQRGEKEGEGRQFATTLTFFLGFWPHAYLLQVGDSRCYVFQEGKLTRISRDQTLAQELVDSGVLAREHAERTRWANVLSSAIGGVQAAPVVSRVVRTWGSVVLLCSDGLTKHVSEDEIEDRIANMTNARQVGEELLELALDRGGTDNITIVIGRTLPEKDHT